jgi:hypothetical protein
MKEFKEFLNEEAPTLDAIPGMGNITQTSGDLFVPLSINPKSKKEILKNKYIKNFQSFQDMIEEVQPKNT